MNIACTINEWDHCFLDGAALTTDFSRKQAKLLSDCGIVEITELAQGIRIKSNSYIGRINLDGISLRITPKLNGLPLVRLLCYAYGLKDLKLYSQAQYETDSLDLFDLLIYTLHEYADHLIRRSFAKGYLFKHEELSAVRGRIDVRKIASGGGVLTTVLPCRYHQREEDILLNQVLLSGLQLACLMASNADLKYQLKTCIGILAETVTGIPLNDLMIKAAKHSITRLTEDYRPIIDVIELLYHMQAPEIDADGKQISLPGYFFDMNHFFEALVSKLMKTLPEEFGLVDQYHLKSLFAYDSMHNPQKRKTPVPRPDFALSKRGTIVRLFDAKYRDLWGRNLPSDMLYQLSIYAVSGVGDGKATILYPALSERPEIQVVNLIHPMYGTKMAQVELKSLNLIRISELLACGDKQLVGDYMSEQILPL